MTAPAGFEPLATTSPFNTAVGPYYCSHQEDGLVIGLAVDSHHCNTAGMLHGAMFGAMADIAMGHNIGLALVSHLDPKAATETYGRGAPGAPIATVSLSVDFAGTARKGDWVEVHVDVQRVGGTLAYASAYLHLGDERIGRASGVFRILNKRS